VSYFGHYPPREASWVVVRSSQLFNCSTKAFQRFHKSWGVFTISGPAQLLNLLVFVSAFFGMASKLPVLHFGSFRSALPGPALPRCPALTQKWYCYDFCPTWGSGQQVALSQVCCLLLSVELDLLHSLNPIGPDP
jgi:hypothetical protein